jgi:hypothetical protein
MLYNTEYEGDTYPEGDDCPEHGPYADDDCPKCEGGCEEE